MAHELLLTYWTRIPCLLDLSGLTLRTSMEMLLMMGTGLRTMLWVLD